MEKNCDKMAQEEKIVSEKHHMDRDKLENTLKRRSNHRTQIQVLRHQLSAQDD